MQMMLFILQCSGLLRRYLVLVLSIAKCNDVLLHVLFFFIFFFYSDCCSVIMDVRTSKRVRWVSLIHHIAFRRLCRG